MVSLVAFFALSQAQQPTDPYEALAKKMRTLVGKWDTVEKAAIREIKGTFDVRPALDDAVVLEYSSTDNKSLLVFGLYGEKITSEKDKAGTIYPHVVVHMTNGGAVFTDFFGDVKGDTLTAVTKDKRQSLKLTWEGDKLTFVRSLTEKGKDTPFITITATRAKP